MKIEFNKREYLNTHGKNPSGKGYWAFQIEGTSHTMIRKVNSTLTEAKKYACSWARSILNKNLHYSITIKILP